MFACCKCVKSGSWIITFKEWFTKCGFSLFSVLKKKKRGQYDLKSEM